VLAVTTAPPAPPVADLPNPIAEPAPPLLLDEELLEDEELLDELLPLVGVAEAAFELTVAPEYWFLIQK
jgi:hypothetical protein